MNWNVWMRQAHRWLSMGFTALVVLNIVLNLIPSMSEGIVLGVGFLTLLPLILLLITGLYLFVLPYRTKRRNEQQTS